MRRIPLVLVVSLLGFGPACSFIKNFDDFTVVDGSVAADGGMDAPAADVGAGADTGVPDGQGPVDQRRPPTRDEFLNSVFNRFCELSTFCETKLRQAGVGDLAQIFELACHPDVRHHPLLTQFLGIDISNAVFAPENALACLDYAEGLSCDIFLGGVGLAFDACREAFLGAVGTNGNCTSDWDCEGDAYCARPAASCGGVCAPRASAGDPCTSANGCSGELACINGACTTRSAFGGICGDNAHCGTDDQCPEGMWCPSTGVCACRPEGGEECATGLFRIDPCTDEFVCSGGANGNCITGQTEGENCGPVNRCAAGLRCVGGTCAVIAGPGEPCQPGEADPMGNCPLGFVCSSNRCEPLPVIGQSCADLGVCIIGVCGGGPGGSPDVCGLLPDGEACTHVLECDGTCREGLCGPLGGDGDACGSFLDCRPDFACFRESLISAPACRACSAL